jgi:hypothetical protein
MSIHLLFVSGFCISLISDHSSATVSYTVLNCNLPIIVPDRLFLQREHELKEPFNLRGKYFPLETRNTMTAPNAEASGNRKKLYLVLPFLQAF